MCELFYYVHFYCQIVNIQIVTLLCILFKRNLKFKKSFSETYFEIGPPSLVVHELFYVDDSCHLNYNGVWKEPHWFLRSLHNHAWTTSR